MTTFFVCRFLKGLGAFFFFDKLGLLPCINGGIYPVQKSPGFTLIELLVVVLIIGILSAVALPQYEKAVEKSRSAQALTLLRSFYNAQQAYYMANGVYASKIDDLDLSISWTGRSTWYNGATDTKSNEDWSLQINPAWGGVYLGRIKGPYQGAGFIMVYDANNTAIGNPGQIQCLERTAAGLTFGAGQGAYCQKIMNGTPLSPSNGYRYLLK